MDYMVFRAALRASAKVALTATLASCAGIVQSTNRADTRDGGASPSPTGTAPIAIAPRPAMVDERAYLADAARPATVDYAVSIADVPRPPTVDDATPLPAACDPPPVASLLPEIKHLDARVSDETFECCVSLLAPELLLDAQPRVFTDAAAHDPNVLDCCAVAIYRVDRGYGDPDAGARDRGRLADAGLTSFNSLRGCCAALAYPLVEGPTCTPWGPPMPPAMPEMA